MSTTPKQIQVTKTLDVETVERVLAELWQETGGVEHVESEDAVMRSRAANVMLFVTSEAALEQSQQTIRELALLHPCRAIVMLSARNEPDRDIEMFVSAFCQTERRSKKAELCCEEITLEARGKFVSELPSAATPLLVPDLPVFLWWNEITQFDDDCFLPLTRAAERLVIDSVDLSAGNLDLSAVAQLFSRKSNEAIAVSDINWARLTSWRALLANFYDIQEYRVALDDLNVVRIDYVGPATNVEGIATQGLLMAGWLASRLHWNIESDSSAEGHVSLLVRTEAGRAIRLELTRVKSPAIKPGRLAKVELQSESTNASFTVRRADNGLHLETEAMIEGRACPGRTLPVRNRSTAQLLSREMEILNRDTTYEAAVRIAARIGK